MDLERIGGMSQFSNMLAHEEASSDGSALRDGEAPPRSFFYHAELGDDRASGTHKQLERRQERNLRVYTAGATRRQKPHSDRPP